MNPARIFALIIGVFLTALGLAGFIPSLMSTPDALPYAAVAATAAYFGFVACLFTFSDNHFHLYLYLSYLC